MWRAIRKDLTLELLDQRPLRLAKPAFVARDAERRLRKPYQSQQPRIAVRCVTPGRREIGGLVLQAQHEGAIGSPLRAVEDQPGVRKPGQHPARNDLGCPCQRRPATCAADPLSNKPARQQLIVQCAHAAEMPQPTEAMQFPSPCLARLHHREWRKVANCAVKPARPTLPEFDFIDEAWIWQPQVGRREREVIGYRRTVAPAHKPRPAHPRQAFHAARARLPTPPVRSCRWRRGTTGPESSGGDRP